MRKNKNKMDWGHALLGPPRSATDYYEYDKWNLAGEKTFMK